MIDFRYHIVSLIAVFLALAVGVVLGAGPLRGSIGEQLTVQIETLRQEKEDLRIQLEDAAAANEDLTELIEAAAPRLIEGTLAEVDVAVVELPGAEASQVDAILERIGQAGGSLVGHLALDARWTDAAESASRDTVAAEVGGQMLIPPADDAPSSLILGQALAISLTERDPLSTDAFTLAAQSIYSTLQGNELFEEIQTPAMPADVVLLVAPASQEPSEEEADAVAEAVALEVDTVTGFAGRNAVLGGTDVLPTDLVDAVRGDAEAAAAVSTVDSIDVVIGQVIVPIALAATAGGAGVGHYGVAPDVTAVLPTIPPPPDPPEQPTDEPTDDPTDGSTDEADDAATTEEGTS